MSDSEVELGIALSAGLMSHRAFFVHGERDLIAAMVAGLHIIAFILIAPAENVLGSLGYRQVFNYYGVLNLEFSGCKAQKLQISKQVEDVQ
ncbi:MAG: hypothetical protein Q9212_000033 [Teloschistes hypoglaucus]